MLRLTKHHALGNDFLVLIGTDGGAAMARALCDRRTGVGADGLISIVGESRWVLHNADGSRAESSGNGLRCAAQAVARARGVDALDVTFETDAGPRRVQLEGDVGTVEMGRVVVKRLGERDADVDVGNPHLVLLVEDPSTFDLVAFGAAHADVNVEVIAPAGTDELAFRVHERGAGITMACGTGSCAAVAAAHAWGLVGTSVVVHNPGGDVTVDLKGEEALLSGPTVFIAVIEVPWL
jgi:diaminopimelate epimerase